MAHSMTYTTLFNNVGRILKLSSRLAANQAPQSIFIEKRLEEPIIVLKEEDNVNLIGPPDPISHLRPVIYKIHKNETELQQQFRELANTTQKWNQEFWAIHNTNFLKQKDDYIKQHRSRDKTQLNADEMSKFYKDFLDKNWDRHVKYNFEWYNKNFTLLLLAFRVYVEKLKLKLL
ncbi:cytochrome c oxidase assembly factor 8 [Rhynchophorus ferrugineus]|uniref:APOPT family protein CG14806, mitochondrial n=1 Tax=Rhynchophorus ferrugineus TaxID=354439 RepID=A0A834IS87_RHYFE|nr:hypothetical protein GWI33_005656 [Rhynchophorus ferrugineus]